MRKLLFTLTTTTIMASSLSAAAPAGYDDPLAPSAIGSQKTLATSGDKKPVVIPRVAHQFTAGLVRHGVGPKKPVPGHMRAVILANVSDQLSAEVRAVKEKLGAEKFAQLQSDISEAMNESISPAAIKTDAIDLKKLDPRQLIDLTIQYFSDFQKRWAAHWEPLDKQLLKNSSEKSARIIAEIDAKINAANNRPAPSLDNLSPEGQAFKAELDKTLQDWLDLLMQNN